MTCEKNNYGMYSNWYSYISRMSHKISILKNGLIRFSLRNILRKFTSENIFKSGGIFKSEKGLVI
jgi:hypothetical protein